MTRILVTGVAGFIGSHIAETLLQEGHEVLGLDDMSYGREVNLSVLRPYGRFRFVPMDIRDEAGLRECLPGVEEVYHQAAIASVPYSVEHPQETDEVNRIGTLNILESALENKVRKVVLASSAAVYGNDPRVPKQEDMRPSPESPYASQKLACEHFAQMFSKVHGLPVVALRYFNVYGPRQDPESMYAAAIPRIISRFLDAQPPIVYGDGEQTRDFIFVGDVVRANLLAMRSQATGVYNVGCGQAISINDLVGVIGEILGSDLRAEHQPPRLGDVRHSRADISRIASLGFSPAHDLRSGLQETVRWFSSTV
ncbi:MAG: SDR family oxidoreductase [Candidatus Methanomethylophilaceae archaeon]|jgi:UDP-glucose 4-epimerase